MNKDIGTWHSLVESVLVEFPYTRNSDSKLYMEVCRKVDPSVEYLGFLYVFNNLNELGLPNTDTIRRCRQKIQADHEELRASDAVMEAKYKLFKEVRKYANE